MPELTGENGVESKQFELNSVERDDLRNPFVPYGFMTETEVAVSETLAPCKLLDKAPLTLVDTSLFHSAVEGRLHFKEHPIRIRAPEGIRRRYA